MADTVYKIIDETVLLGMHITANGAGITGEAPTVEVRRLRDGRYLNFDTMLWTTSGGTKEKVLTPKSWLPSLYTWAFDQATLDPGVAETYVAIYRNTGSYAFEVTKFYVFTFRWDATIEFLRKILSNKSRLERLDATHANWKVYEDDGVAVALEEDITVSGAVETREKV